MTRLQIRRAVVDCGDNWSGGVFLKTFIVFKYMVSNLEETLQSRDMWCLLTCTGFSIAGVVHEFFWFAFTLVYLLIFSSYILEVTNAVWQPRRRILSTVVLSFIVLYWFAIIAYVSLDEDFDVVVNGSSETLRRSFILIFDSWYKFTLGGFLADSGRSAIMNDDNNYELKGERLAFDFMFFFIVPTLLLSILSGIIIDNFVERRSQSDSISQRQNEQCFICGTPANDMQDFHNHCKFQHNIWDYMYYIGYLRVLHSRDLKDYRDIYVSHCLVSNNNDWFPAYRDFVLARVNQSDATIESLSRSLETHNVTVNTKLSSIETSLASLRKSMEIQAQTLASIQSSAQQH